MKAKDLKLKLEEFEQLEIKRDLIAQQIGSLKVCVLHFKKNLKEFNEVDVMLGVERCFIKVSVDRKRYISFIDKEIKHKEKELLDVSILIENFEIN